MENKSPVFIIEPEERSKNSSVYAVILMIAFLAVLGIGGTFAYLTWTGNQTPNRMSTRPEITADLLEPNWTNAVVSQVGNSSAGKASDGEYIPLSADGMTPGSVVAKNPFVVNTSKSGLDAYVGIKLEFQKWTVETDGATDGSWKTMTDDELSKLLKVFTFSSSSETSVDPGINDNSLGINWVEAFSDSSSQYHTQGTKYYYYQKTIAALTSEDVAHENASSSTWGYPEVKQTPGSEIGDGEKATTPLFKYVIFSENATNDSIKDMVSMLKGDHAPADPGWRVVITCGAVQHTNGDNGAMGYTHEWVGVTWKDILDGSSNKSSSGVREGQTSGSHVAGNSNSGNMNAGIPEAL